MMVMVKLRVETYEQGTGKIIKVEEIDVPDEIPPVDDDDVRKLVKYAKNKGWI